MESEQQRYERERDRSGEGDSRGNSGLLQKPGSLFFCPPAERFDTKYELIGMFFHKSLKDP